MSAVHCASTLNQTRNIDQTTPRMYSQTVIWLCSQPWRATSVLLQQNMFKHKTDTPRTPHRQAPNSSAQNNQICAHPSANASQIRRQYNYNWTAPSRTHQNRNPYTTKTATQKSLPHLSDLWSQYLRGRVRYRSSKRRGVRRVL